MEIATVTITENDDEELVARFVTTKKLSVIQLDTVRNALLQVAENLHERIVQKMASVVPLEVADD